MSRFFTAGDSSSESSSDEEELYSEEEPEQKSEEEESSEEEDESDEESSSADSDDGKVGPGKFLKNAGDSDSEGSSDSDTPKIVKSAKGKRLEEVEQVIKLIENAQKINDWSSISTGQWLYLQVLLD